MTKWEYPGYRRRLIQGYTDMGRVRVPPLPQGIVMTDRANGNRWLLSHTGLAPSLSFVLTQTLPTEPDYHVFDDREGPYLPGNIRLYVSNGLLLGEINTDGTLHASPRVLTRRGWDRSLLEITAASGWQPGQSLTYTLVTL